MKAERRRNGGDDGVEKIHERGENMSDLISRLLPGRQPQTARGRLSENTSAAPIFTRFGNRRVSIATKCEIESLTAQPEDQTEIKGKQRSTNVWKCPTSTAMIN